MKDLVCSGCTFQRGQRWIPKQFHPNPNCSRTERRQGRLTEKLKRIKCIHLQRTLLGIMMWKPCCKMLSLKLQSGNIGVNLSNMWQSHAWTISLHHRRTMKQRGALSNMCSDCGEMFVLDNNGIKKCRHSTL